MFGVINWLNYAANSIYMGVYMMFAGLHNKGLKQGQLVYNDHVHTQYKRAEDR
jgi:hypothetical protein